MSTATSNGQPTVTHSGDGLRIEGHSLTISRNRVKIYHDLPGQTEGTTLSEALFKQENPGPLDPATKKNKRTRQGIALGRKMRPYNYDAIIKFRDSNEHHATCLATKVAATVGLGHRDVAADKAKAQMAADQQNQQIQQQNQDRQMAMEAHKANVHSIMHPAKPAAKADPTGLPSAAPAQNPLQGVRSDTAAFDTMMDAMRIGHSWKPSKVDEVLNPLCDEHWQDVITCTAEDFWELGAGYIEVVRKGKRGRNGLGLGPITGVHHIPAIDVWINVEDNDYNRHYEIATVFGSDPGFGATAWGLSNNLGVRRFARFGDKADFLARVSARGSLSIAFAGDGSVVTNKPEFVSEVIQIKNPSARNRWYGWAQWLSAVPAITVYRYMQQYLADFFLNRGVPEYLLFLLGAAVDNDSWKKIDEVLKAGIGLGNSHKSGAFNLINPNIKVQLERLAMEGGKGVEDNATKESLALSTVTAHRVPPLLAGIQIPGKLGATNELPNALMAFQVLCIGQAQRLFQQKLGMTLGNPETNGGLELTPEDFALNSIIEEIDVGNMDTVARMRQTPMQANAEGRDLKAGVKK